jgi:hypothetical protein
MEHRQCIAVKQVAGPHSVAGRMARKETDRLCSDEMGEGMAKQRDKTYKIET